MIPARYEKASYNDVPQNIKDMVKSMRTSKRGIYIHGNVGSGKTHIAYAIKKKWDEVMGENSKFWNTTELLQEIKDDFDRGYADKSHILERLMDTQCLLFLDDIGAEKNTEWVMERFYLLINRRYVEMRPVIFTSNYSIAELSARLGDRVASRIVELCDVVRLDGTDRRLPV